MPRKPKTRLTEALAPIPVNRTGFSGGRIMWVTPLLPAHSSVLRIPLVEHSRAAQAIDGD
jgi:hypothetical protein